MLFQKYSIATWVNNRSMTTCIISLEINNVWLAGVKLTTFVWSAQWPHPVINTSVTKLFYTNLQFSFCSHGALCKEVWYENVCHTVHVYGTVKRFKANILLSRISRQCRCPSNYLSPSAVQSTHRTQHINFPFWYFLSLCHHQLLGKIVFNQKYWEVYFEGNVMTSGKEFLVAFEVWTFHQNADIFVKWTC